MFPSIPDIRFDQDYIGYKWFTPSHVHKENILNPENAKQNKDFLLNNYFKKRDYEATHEKMFYITLSGAKTGVFFGLFDVMSQNVTQVNKGLLIFAKNFSFCTASFATYGAVTNIVANIRGKKDDVFNHAFGGASLGFIFAYLYRSSAIGCLAGVGFAGLGAWLKKFYLDGKYVFHPNFIREGNLITGGKYQDGRFIKTYEEPIRKSHYIIN